MSTVAFVQVLCVVLVSVAMALSLAHVLEWPGKMRLDEGAYRAVQAIYYPGFTVGGLVGDVGGTLATGALLLLTPRGTFDFRVTLAALVCLAAMHAVYWGVTHEVNRTWVEGQHLGAGSRAFFAAGPASEAADWRTLRLRWERSHAVRAALAFAAFFALLLAAATPR